MSHPSPEPSSSKQHHAERRIVRQRSPVPYIPDTPYSKHGTVTNNFYGPVFNFSGSAATVGDPHKSDRFASSTVSIRLPPKHGDAGEGYSYVVEFGKPSQDIRSPVNPLPNLDDYLPDTTKTRHDRQKHTSKPQQVRHPAQSKPLPPLPSKPSQPIPNQPTPNPQSSRIQRTSPHTSPVTAKDPPRVETSQRSPPPKVVAPTPRHATPRQNIAGNFNRYGENDHEQPGNVSPPSWVPRTVDFHSRHEVAGIRNVLPEDCLGRSFVFDGAVHEAATLTEGATTLLPVESSVYTRSFVLSTKHEN